MGYGGGGDMGPHPQQHQQQTVLVGVSIGVKINKYLV